MYRYNKVSTVCMLCLSNDPSICFFAFMCMHACIVLQDTTLTLTGSVEPAHPSILYNCSSEGLLESSNYSLITVGSSDVMLVPAFSAYLSVTGKATFVIGTETGSMVVVTLPAHGSGGELLTSDFSCFSSERVLLL